MTIREIFKRKPKPSVEADSVSVFEFARPEIPCIIEKKKDDWVWYGENNDYPLFLTEILSTSAIHNAIIEGKTQMMAGSGLLINGAKDKAASDAAYSALPSAVKAQYDLFLQNPNDEPISKITKKFAKCWQKNGSAALEIVYSMDFSRIATVKYINTDHVRAGKMENGKVSHYYIHRDWTKQNARGFNPTKIAAFDPKNRDDYNQLIFVKNGTLEYYGEPSYQGAMSWIKIDSQMGLFHLSNIQNGFAPSLVFKFYKKPSSPEKQQEVMDNIKSQYGGPKNAGKALVFFSDGKELAPDVEPIEVSNLDKQFLLLGDQVVQQIMSGHRVTVPQLFGVNVPGKLGGSGSELETGYRIYDNSVVEPDRNVLEEVYNAILEVNKVAVTIEVDKFNPLREDIKSEANTVTSAINSLSPLVANKVLESMTPDEIRALIGLGKTLTPPTNG